MSTKSKKKQSMPDTNDLVLRKRIENSWILLIKEPILENNSFQMITLPHPAHGCPAKYILDNLHRKIYEVVTFREPYRSWFISDTVKSDGSVIMVTPINPLFLVLPRLSQQCANRAIPLKDLLSEKGFDKIMDYIVNLDSVADLKGPPNLKAYKYNEEKTLNWLENKIRKLAIVLREKNIHVTSGAVSATFVTSNVNNANIDEEFYLKYAHGIMSEYLEEGMVELIENKFNFKIEVIEHIGNKRKSEVEFEDVNKKIKLESNGVSEVKFIDSTTETKKQKPLTVKEKARQKAASKTKTISSFFCKK